MIRTAVVRGEIGRPSVLSPARRPPATLQDEDGFALYCTAAPGPSPRFMGRQTAQDILTRGFRNEHYRYSAKLNDWIAPTEWVEGDAVELVDSPTDPVRTTGVQIEVILSLPWDELSLHEMVRAYSIGVDWTGQMYRRYREFYAPASILNERGRVRITPPQEAFEKCLSRNEVAETTKARRLKMKETTR